MSTWNAKTASLIVDFHHIRCGGCKVIVADPLAEHCPTCGAVFDRVLSNHVGLADRLIRQRNEHREPAFEAHHQVATEEVVLT